MKAELDIGLKAVCLLGVVAPHAPREILAPSSVSLAFMAGFIELACEDAIRFYLDAGERSYGTAMRLSRQADRAPEGEMTIRTELVGLHATRLGFRFECRDERGVLSSGYHERLVIAAPSQTARRAA